MSENPAALARRCRWAALMCAVSVLALAVVQCSLASPPTPDRAHGHAAASAPSAADADHAHIGVADRHASHPVEAAMAQQRAEKPLRPAGYALLAAVALAPALLARGAAAPRGPPPPPRAKRAGRAILNDFCVIRC